ncbi:6126_t:CDS:2 [Funneliformis caledonium]|uniref:6126_t:CDS:1 n=1 Tax=Funneliformis caledonium TaxID=1117310 RepID=A0A9N9E5T6_9GLOM|nr:6126_t:CDS:2 [Funneliformis caledonium]
MSCSKIFTGDLPEITIFIIQYLRNDIKSLHSCILVNRHLCRVAIPILWEDPFSVKCQPKNGISLLDMYFLFFNQEDKAKLRITTNLSFSPLFNYPNFIKVLNTNKVKSHIFDRVTLYSSTGELQSFLTSTSSIKHLNIHVDEFEASEILSDLIQSQPQLLTLSTQYSNVSLSNAAFKSYPISLTSIKFTFCDFLNVSSFDDFKYLTQLRSLQFIYCKGINTQFFQPLLDISTPSLEIKTLKVVGMIEGITLLLQKIGPYLELLELNLTNVLEKNKSFESVVDYCNKIKYLCVGNFDDGNILQLYNMITHNKHIKYLTIGNDNARRKSNILEGLGQILPNSLKYLILVLPIDPIHLNIFFDHCHHIDNLLIKNLNRNDIDITFKYLKNFVKEKKGVKNLAYYVNDIFEPLIHQKLEQMACEIQPFVKMKDFYESIVDISDFEISC